MEVIKCNVCLVACVGCRGKCKCNMNKSQVKAMNILIEGKSQDEITTLIGLVVAHKISTNFIKGALSSGISIEDIKNEYNKDKKTFKTVYVNKIADELGLCTYPVGSGALGKWAECTKCGLPKFNNPSGKCPVLEDKE